MTNIEALLSEAQDTFALHHPTLMAALSIPLMLLTLFGPALSTLLIAHWLGVIP